jgi:hypothetical protein
MKTMRMAAGGVGILAAFLGAALVLALAGPVQSAPAEKAPAAAAPAEEKKISEESIYIPYKKLREVFEKEGRGVFLPYDKFLELWKAAQDKQPAALEVKPPVAALITDLAAKATVAKDVVTVDATLKIEILKEGWVEVPLRLGDSAITKAMIGDQPARILGDPATGYRLLVEKKGKEAMEVVLAIQFAKAYTKSPGQNSVSFDAPQAPVSKWEVRIPEKGVKVNIRPLLAATEVPAGAAAPAANETAVLAFVGAAPSVTIDWTPKAEGATGLEALVSVQAQHRLTIDEGAVRTWVQMAYEISRAELARLVIDVPADQKVVNVFDPNVRQWAVETVEGVQRITAQLFEPAKNAQSVVVELEKFTQGDKRDVTLPIVKAVGAGRQQGVVVVQVAQGLRAEAAKYTGLLQVDPNELPPALKGTPWAFSYRYAALPFELVLSVEKVQPRIVADSLVELNLKPEELTVDLTVVYTIERAGVFNLAIQVPEGFEVRQVRGVAAPGASPVEVDNHHVDAAQPGRLLVNLSRKAFGKAALAVQLHKRLTEPDLLTPTGKAATLALAVPRVAPGSVERETGRIVVYAPESLQINPVKSDGLRAISFQEAIQGMKEEGKGGPALRSVLAFAFTQEPVTLTASAERRKPQVTARQLLVARIESGVVKYEATLFYDILYSGVKTLRVDVPQDLAAPGGIRIATRGIEKDAITPAPKDVPEKYVAWSLRGETEFLGHQQVRLEWEKKIEKLDVGKSVDLEIPRLIPRDVDREWGQIVIVKAETIDVREGEKAAGLRPIDPQNDLAPGTSVPGAARAFEFHDTWSLPITATMYKLEVVKRTSIERALIRWVVTRGPTVSIQALYRMRSAQQRLQVQLPEGVSFDTEPLRIKGRAVSLEQGDKGQFFIPLVGQNPDEPFLLELRYTLTGTGERLDCPEFPEEPAIQKVYVAAFLPEERTLLGWHGPWTDEFQWQEHGCIGYKLQDTRDDSAELNWVREGIDVKGNPENNFQTDGRLYVFSTLRPKGPPEGSLALVSLHRDWLWGLVIGLILVGGLVLVPFRSGLRWLVVGGFVVLMVLLGVFLPTFARQITDDYMLAAIFVVLVVWFLWYVVRTRPRDPLVKARKEARLAAIRARMQKVAAPAPAAAPSTRPPPSGKAKSEGGEPHA